MRGSSGEAPGTLELARTNSRVCTRSRRGHTTTGGMKIHRIPYVLRAGFIFYFQSQSIGFVGYRNRVLKWAAALLPALKNRAIAQRSLHSARARARASGVCRLVALYSQGAIDGRRPRRDRWRQGKRGAARRRRWPTCAADAYYALAWRAWRRPSPRVLAVPSGL